jgi:hypothetical protein
MAFILPGVFYFRLIPPEERAHTKQALIILGVGALYLSIKVLIPLASKAFLLISR